METSIIGYDESEVLDYEPARWFVRVTKREKRACGKCSTIAMPELAPRIVEKGLASDTVVIHTVVAKYCDHLPLYRQQTILEREAGVEDQPRHPGWLGDAGGRVAHASRLCDAAGLTARSPTYRPTKLRFPFKCTTNAAPIIKRTYGNTEGPAAKRCSTFSWAAGAKVRASSWVSGKGYCKPTAIRSTTMSAGPRWCMWGVGRIISTPALSSAVSRKPLAARV